MPDGGDVGRALTLLAAGSETDIDHALRGFEQCPPAMRRMKSLPVPGLRALAAGHFVVDRVEATAKRWNPDTGAGIAGKHRRRRIQVCAQELAAITFDGREGG
ncbi:MAG: hypothetical protein F4Y02_15525 [Chloroflexi bacterium]|nr:hypothetical protein [Chloroflexota bacterium]